MLRRSRILWDGAVGNFPCKPVWWQVNWLPHYPNCSVLKHWVLVFLHYLPGKGHLFYPIHPQALPQLLEQDSQTRGSRQACASNCFDPQNMDFSFSLFLCAHPVIILVIWEFILILSLPQNWMTITIFVKIRSDEMAPIRKGKEGIHHSREHCIWL